MKRRALTLSVLLFANSIFAEPPAHSGRVFGSEIAATTIDLYSDFECPNCQKLYFETLKPLIENYAKKSRIHLVEHYYPLPGHAHSVPAACYACAADRIGKFEEVCDILFKKQEEWSRTGNVDQTACSVLTPSEAAKVRELAKSASVRDEVQADVALGQKHNVNGTPTMLITHNGKTQVIGQVSYAILSRYLDSLH